MYNFKIIVAIIFGFLLHNQIFSQDSLYFENLTSKEKYVLIVGIDNVLKFDPSVDNILFNAENVLKTGSIFKFKPNQVGAVSVMLFSGSAMMGSIDFEVKYSKLELLKNQDPRVRLGRLPFSKNEPKGYQTKLELYSGNSNTLSPLQIISFEATCVPKNGDIITIQHKSEVLDKKIIEYLTYAKSGDVLLIENVKVKSPDGTMRKIPGLTTSIEK
jgi:hypothetical protein